MSESDENNDSEEGMPSIEIQDEELAREIEKEQRQGKLITYFLFFLFICIALYILYSMFATGVVGELDVLSRFIDLLSKLLGGV